MTTDMPEDQIIEDAYLRFVNDDNSLYNLEVLSKDNSDYKLVEKSIINTCCEFEKKTSSTLKLREFARFTKKSL